MKLPEQHTDSLRDIHLPDAISWWPPAIGWWVLLALVIAAVVFIPKLYRRISYTPLNKVAKTTFENIVTDYNENHNDAALVTETSQFLRQIAMSYYSRGEIAQLTGEEWVYALNKITEHNHFNESVKQYLINAPYQKEISIDSEQLITAVQNWLERLPKQPQGRNK
ncbi:MAG: DUF4381 domain-containing protein [Woeseiaceae bacterium]